MTRVQTRIHSEFGELPFTVREAQVRGFGRGALRNATLSAPHRGVRATTPTGESLVERARALLPLLRPGDRFSHTTALALFGCPVYVPPGTPVDVETTRSALMRRHGVRGHRAAPDSPSFTLRIPEHDDPAFERLPLIPVGVPLSVVKQSAAMLPCSELVVALDFLIRPDSRHFDSSVVFDLGALVDSAREARPGRGIRRFRIASALAREGAASRMETLTRLIAERVGLDSLVLQLEVRDAAGAYIGSFDLGDEASRGLFEFDGEQHRQDRRQYLHDLERLDRVRDAGWRPLRFHREDILDRPDRTAARMLAHVGERARPIPAELRRALAERFDEPTVSTLPHPHRLPHRNHRRSLEFG